MKKAIITLLLSSTVSIKSLNIDVHDVVTTIDNYMIIEASNGVWFMHEFKDMTKNEMNAKHVIFVNNEYFTCY